LSIPKTISKRTNVNKAIITSIDVCFKTPATVYGTSAYCKKMYQIPFYDKTG